MVTEIEGFTPGQIGPTLRYYTATNTNTADLFNPTDIVVTPIVLNVVAPEPAPNNNEITINTTIQLEHPIDFININVSVDDEPATPEQQLISRNLQSLLSSRGVSLDNLSPQHREVLELGQELDGCVIAGGAPLSLYRGTFDYIKDWDLFFDLDANRDEAQAKLLNMGFEKSAETEWSISYEKNGVVAQTIRFKNFNSVEAIFKSFDISVCCFAIEENHMTFTKQAQDDVENMSLNFLGTTNPVWCLNRIIKYAMKGFKLTNQSAINFLLKAKEFSAPSIKKNGSARAGATSGES